MIYHPMESGGTLELTKLGKKRVGAPTEGQSPHRIRVSPCGLEDGYFTISLRTAVASAPVRRTK